MKTAIAPLPIRLPVWRRRLVLIGLLLLFAGLMGRSLYLQVLHKSFLQEQGANRYSRKQPLQAQRGKILDRNGAILAISSPVESIWINPRDFKPSQEQLLALSKLLAVAPEKISEKAKDQKRGFIFLKRRLSPEVASRVMQLQIAGMFSKREYRRYYPAAEVSAHLVGFTGLEENGQEGMELRYEAILAGKPGSRRVIMDAHSHILDDLGDAKAPQDGQDVVMSIDRKLQYLAYRETLKAVEEHHAKAGAAIVLDARTGEILAMANLPTYNPNNPVNINGKSRNRAIVDVFEPGSTMKPMAIAAGLESGKYKPDSLISTTPGFYSIGSATIHDTHNYGALSVAGVIQKSSNVGASKIALSLSPQYLWGIYSHLGFGTLTQIGFPGEVSGKLRHFKTWRPIEQATMSYGNGISVTLLQLARAYTVFANAGELRPLSLLKLDETPIGQQVFSAETANAVKDMLELVVQPGGTAPLANIMGYRVAGKTGTAHKPGIGGYEKDKYVASFVGFAPASAPRLIVAIIIDEPSNGQHFGGMVAAPVFARIMSEALRHLSVPQDASEENVLQPVPDASEIQEDA